MYVPRMMAGAATRCFRAIGMKPGIREEADCVGLKWKSMVFLFHLVSNWEALEVKNKILN